jgi:hypothetical protein
MRSGMGALIRPSLPNPDGSELGIFEQKNLQFLPQLALTIMLHASSVDSPRCLIALSTPSPGATREDCMSSGPQVSPEIGYRAGMFDKTSSLAMRSPGATVVSCPSVLLVGRNGSWGASLLKSLEKLGAELFFMTPEALTAEIARKNGFHLILLDSTVPAEQRRQLVSELLGSSVSIFYTFPVENGCWWLPTLRHGQDCHGTPAFRRNEFRYELERILLDQSEA